MDLRQAILLTTFLLFVPAVFATTIDAQPQLPVYICSPATHSFTITNTEAATIGIGIFAAGKPAKYITYEPQSFWLAAGQTQTVLINIDTPCDVKRETLITQIVGTDGHIEELSQEIAALVPNNIVLRTADNTEEIKVCGKAEYTATLKNPINFEEKYSFSGEAEGFRLELPENTTLGPGEEKEVQFIIEAEDCTLSGNYKIKIKAHTDKTGLTATLPLLVKIDTEGVPEFDFPEKITFFDEGKDEVLEITNTGDETADFIVEMQGPEWVKVKPRLLTIEGKNTEEITLTLTPPETSTKEEVNITIKSPSINAEYQHTINIRYHKKNWTENNGNVILGILIGICVIIMLALAGYRHGKKGNLRRKRLNRIEKRRQRILSYWRTRADIRKARIQSRNRHRQSRIQARQRRMKRKKPSLKWLIKLVILAIAISVIGFLISRFPDTIKEYQEYIISGTVLLAIFILIVKYAKSKPKKEKVRIEKPLVQDLVKAHKTEKIIKENKQTEKVQGKGLAWLLIIAGILIIAGAGIQYSESLRQYGYYVIAGFVILLAIILTKTVKRTPGKKLKEGESEDIAYKGLHFTIHANKDTRVCIGKAKLSSKVPGKIIRAFKLEADNADSIVTFDFKNKDIKLYKWDGKWKRVEVRSMEADEQVFHDAEITSGTYVITGKKAESAFKAWQVILWVVAVLSISSMIAIWLPETVPTNFTGIQDQTWEQNSDHYLNLSKYFKDPDNDELTITAIAEGPVTVDVQGTMARLIPEQGWTGQAFVTFTATDTEGETATSNKVKLVITKPYKKPFTFFLVILFIASIAILLIKTRKQSPMSPR